jgi:hypothetical protein
LESREKELWKRLRTVNKVKAITNTRTKEPIDKNMEGYKTRNKISTLVGTCFLAL